MLNDLLLIQNDLLEAYLKEVPSNLQQAFDNLHDAELSTTDFSFYTSVSSVYSSKIEGEAIELDSFIKYKRDGIRFRADYTQKIDDLYNAYIFAQTHQFSQSIIAEAHKLLSQHILDKKCTGRAAYAKYVRFHTWW